MDRWAEPPISITWLLGKGVRHHALILLGYFQGLLFLPTSLPTKRKTEKTRSSFRNEEKSFLFSMIWVRYIPPLPRIGGEGCNLESQLPQRFMRLRLCLRR
jgi:hypothetical protein